MTLAFETAGAGRLRDLDPGAGDVRWQVLGPVAATRQGAALDLGAPRQRAVLTLLLSGAGDTVPLSRIVEAVWGQDPPRYAVNTVHKHVGALRRVVEPGLPPVAYASAGLASVDRPGNLASPRPRTGSRRPCGASLTGSARSWW